MRILDRAVRVSVAQVVTFYPAKWQRLRNTVSILRMDILTFFFPCLDLSKANKNELERNASNLN